MARTAIERPVQLSVLDRLLDEEPRSALDPSMNREESVALLRRAVARDLEWLLNTRQTPELAPEGLPEVAGSLYHYGMPDLSSKSKDAADARDRVRQEIEEAVARFEPRLTGVTVTIAGTVEHSPGEFRFRVEALLRMDPAPERITFETRVEVTTGRFALEGGDGA